VSYSITIVPRAQRHIAEARDWWRANRPEAPTLLGEELDRALQRLVENPNLGSPWPLRADLRRLRLGRVELLLLYRLRPRAQRVEVLALWHGRRGRPPLIRG
jgi:plasmid stabilization system protein ParE